MAEKNKPALPQTGPAADDPHTPKGSPPSQAQSGSGEADFKRENDPSKKVSETDEPQFFDTTIAKLVERETEDADGKKTTEWVEVMSDNLYPGEKLKRDVDAEKAKEKADKLRDDPADAKKADKDSK